MHLPFRAAALLAALVAAACAQPNPPVSTSPSPTTSPEPVPAPDTVARPADEPNAPALPPMPAIEGPLAIKVVYPTANHLIESRDSNFIFGSLGNGPPSPTINGLPPRVHPNGALLSVLPKP